MHPVSGVARVLVEKIRRIRRNVASYVSTQETRPLQGALEHDTEYVAFEGLKRSLAETTAIRRALTEQ